ncbi:unnamed protein product [Rotaria sp. Silwood1]|nr:unnamed protein product [Rotaria sp. Silwood1]
MSYQKKKQKFRNEFDQFMTCFEDLSNELLCEVFDYLDGHGGLYKAFSNLNSRFEELVRSLSVLFKTHCYLIKLDQVTVLPPFEVRKAENTLQKAENNRSFIIEKQRDSRKYVYDMKLTSSS